MKKILITGASRGIGLELTKQLSTIGHHVYATCRQPNRVNQLNSIKSVSPENIQILKIPFRGHIRDYSNLTIDLPNQRELRYSPQNEIIHSSGESIFINRSEMSVVTEITLNLEENDVPIPSITGIGATENFVILDGNPSLNLL